LIQKNNIIQFPGGDQTTFEQTPRDITVNDAGLPIGNIIKEAFLDRIVFVPRVSERQENLRNELMQRIVQTAQAINETAVTREGETQVDWQEKYLDKLDRDIGEIKQSLQATEERIAAMVSQTLGEIRDRDNQRHAEVQTIRADMQAIRSDNEETRRWIIGMAIATILGIAAMVVTVLLK
jgi:hypothetical protein